MEHVVAMGARRPSLFMRAIEHPVDSINSCGVTITRAVEGMAIVTCAAASCALTYFIFGLSNPIALALDATLIGMSGATAYYAHKSADCLIAEARVGRLSHEVNMLNAEVEEHLARFAWIEKLIEGIQSYYVEAITEDDETVKLFVAVEIKVPYRQ